MEDLAARLWQARQEGSVIDPATIVAPASLEEAYAIQDRVTALSGERIVGFKIGSTSVEAQRKLGTDRPGSGPLLARYVRSSPARLALVPDQMPCVEGEFAFRLRRDLPSRAEPYVRDDLVAALDAVTGAIEIVGTRIAGGLGGKGRFLVTADGGVNIGLILGTWHAADRGRDLRSHAVTMRVDGTVAGEGTGERVLGDPLNALVWIANHQSRAGRGLRAGEIISTGTCTGLAPVKPGQRASADFGDLGAVEVEFS